MKIISNLQVFHLEALIYFTGSMWLYVIIKEDKACEGFSIVPAIAQ